MKRWVHVLFIGLVVGAAGCAGNRANLALVQTVEPPCQQVEIPKPVKKAMAFGQPGDGKNLVMIGGEIHARGWVEADESLYSLWQKIGPGEPCEVCGLMPRVLEVQRKIDGEWVKQRYNVKKLTADEQKAVSIKGGDLIMVCGTHL
jgi:hypothetical protein